MKQLARNEWRLLVIFLAACAICLCLVGVRALTATQESTEKSLKDLQAQSEITTAWLQDKDSWEAKAKWMEDHRPPEAPTETAASTLLSNLQAGLAPTGLKILDQGFSPVGNEGPYYTVTVHLKLSGPFGDLAKWLFDVQKSAAYFAIKKISIKSDGEPPQVVCDMEITEYLHGT